MNDNAFDALANEQRRALLLDLLEANPQSVTKKVPADGETEQVESDQHLQIKMYHTHLPKLEDYGFIRWGRDAGEIVKGPQFEEIRPLLECIVDHAEA